MTPRQLVVRARHTPCRHRAGPPLPALPASPYVLLPVVTSLLCSSEATGKPPLAPIKRPLPPRVRACFAASPERHRTPWLPPPRNPASGRLHRPPALQSLH
jgi:hypothetical protein